MTEETRMSQSNGSAGDPKETSDGTAMPPAAEEGGSEKMQLSELLKRHSSQEPGLLSVGQGINEFVSLNLQNR